MKLKRFVASDMREALSMIKEELGADAVIMSNKRVANGVEIVAGIEDSQGGSDLEIRRKESSMAASSAQSRPMNRYLEDDEVTLSSSRKAGAARQGNSLKASNRASPAQKTVGGAKSEEFVKNLLEVLERQQREQSLKERQQLGSEISPEREMLRGTADEIAIAGHKNKTPPAPLAEQGELKELFAEELKREEEKQSEEKKHGISSYEDGGESANSSLKQMQEQVLEIKKLLQFELAGLIKESRTREEPVKAMAAELLCSAGFSQPIARELTENINSDASFNFAWRELGDILEKKISVGNDEIITDGGVVVLIGPAGVGKTTTIAKLAARFVMNYGADKVAIVTADHYRIGAVEQVKTYGRIMGCSAFSVKSLTELPDLLYTLRDKSLVLVDTAGVGLHDERFSAQLSELKNQSRLKLKNYLVLPGTSQRKVLEQAYEHFSGIGLAGLILTKIDETSGLGNALSLCIEKKLKLSYVTDGQRVPEDLNVPEARSLARGALSAVEDDAVRSAFGEN